MKPKKDNLSNNLNKELFEAIASINNVNEAQKFFEDLCTPSELQSMSDRWHVVKLLKEDLSYRKTQSLTNISVTTIGRVARALTFGDGGYNIIYERLKNNKSK